MKGLVVRGLCVSSLLLLAAGCGSMDGGGTAGAGDRPGEADGEAVTGGICPGNDTVHGLDVSVFQGIVDWSRVASHGEKFAVARIGDGLFEDSEFDRNWSGMKHAGLIRGAYQFFEPGESPTEQAAIVVHKVGRLGDGDLPVMLDLEVTGGQSPSTIVDHVQKWVAAVTSGTGKRPYLYTGAFFYDENVHSNALSDLPLNVAWYGTNCPGVPSEWNRWTFHQYTSSGSVPGIGGNVDLDLYDGSLSALRAFAGISIESPGDVITDAGGRMHVFWKSATGRDLEHAHQLDAGGWSSWTNFGGDLASQPVVIANADGNLEVFARFTDGTLHHDWQRHDGSGWHGWMGLGQPNAGKIVDGVSVAANADGRLEVFARTADGSIHHLWQTAPNASESWSDWKSLAGDFTGSPSAALDAQGELQLFAIARSGSVHHARQTAPGGAWSGWSDLGGDAKSDVVVATNADGRLQIFVRGADDSLKTNWQETTSGPWHGFKSLGGTLTSRPTAVLDTLGRLHVFARGDNGSVRRIRQVEAGGSFGGWGGLQGDVTSAPVAGINADGRLIVVARGVNDRMEKIAQLSANGTWGTWVGLGGDF